MAAELLRDLSRASDSNNNPLAGATWSFTETGTTTPLAVYADAELTTSLGSEVTADAGGQFPAIYLDATMAYRGVLENAAGAVIREVDPINDTTLSSLATPGAAQGAALIGFLASGTGAVGRTAQAKMGDIIAAGDYGAVGNGTADDTTALTNAIAAASAAGKPLMLGAAHRVTAAVPVTSDVEIIGNGTVLSTAAHNHALFSFSGERLKISGTVASGEKALVFIENATAFDLIELAENTFAGVQNRAADYFIYTTDNIRSVTGGSVRIHHNTLSYCTAAFLDEVLLDDLAIDDNTMTHMMQFVVRNLDGTDPADPDDHHTCARLSFQRNAVFGINDDFPSRSGVAARLIQVSARESLTVLDNDIRDVIGEGAAASGVYFEFGSLIYGRNSLTSYKSTGSTGNRWISDKGDGSSSDRYKHQLFDNTYDQSAVASADSPEAIVMIETASNIDANGETFIGCHCPGYRVWQSVNKGMTGENLAIRNASFIEHKFPLYIALRAQYRGVVIEGVKGYQLSNPAAFGNSAVDGGDAATFRMVTLYMDVNVGTDVLDPATDPLHLEDIVIRNCTVYGGDADTVIAHIYRHAGATTSTIRGVTIRECTSKLGKLVKFTNSTPSPPRLISNSVGSATLVQGTKPSDTLLLGNTPHGLTAYADQTAAASGGVPIGGEFLVGTVVNRRLV